MNMIYSTTGAFMQNMIRSRSAYTDSLTGVSLEHHLISVEDLINNQVRKSKHNIL